ncbi:Rv3654c family TadE-like protein [Streptomyces sp. NPDC001661]
MAMAAVGVVFGAVLAMAHAVEARHRAGSAADLAALAAADHWMDGRAKACALAARVARAQEATVVRCAVHGEVSSVTATAGAGTFHAEVKARAGPPGARSSPAGD